MFVVEVGVHALFEVLAELLVEGDEGCLVDLGALLQELDDALGEHGGELAHEERVLHRLARDVQRQVLRVDHALEEAHPFGKQSLAAALDEYLARVQVHASVLARHAPLLHVALRHVEERADRERRVRLEVQRVPRVIESLRNVPVKIGVLLDGHLVLRFGPQRLERVDARAVDGDRESHEVGVLADVLLDVEALRKVGLGGLELENDGRTWLHVGRL